MSDVLDMTSPSCVGHTVCQAAVDINVGFEVLNSPFTLTFCHKRGKNFKESL